MAVLCGFYTFGQHTDIINSNKPGESMTAFSVGKTVFQVEGGLYYINEDHSTLEYDAKGFGLNLDARYGFFLEQLELILNSQFQFDKYTASGFEDNRSGFRNLTFGAKYLIYDPFKNYEEKVNIYSWKANQKFKWRRLIPAVAAYAGVNFDIGDDYFHPDEPTISPKVMIITQQHIANRLVFVTNIFANKVTSTEFRTLGYVATLTLGFNQKWSGLLEHKGLKNDYYSDSILTVGAAYLLMNNFQVGATISKNFKDTPDLFYGGLNASWRFDQNYKPVKIEVEDKNEPKRAGKKKDKKKRKDAVDIED